jgi:hypothetical protein
VAASTLELASRGEGVWSATGPNLSLAGIWQVSALVQSASDSVQVDLVVQPRPPPEDIERIEAEGQPTLYTIHLAGGDSVQGYVDPGTAGPNQVHFTFFGADGGELPVEDPEVDAYLMSGALADLELVPFSPGHFAVQGQLDAGSWRFTVRVTTQDDEHLTAYFEEDIEG